MWLEQEKLPPFLPADFHISITIHPDSGEEKERGRERGGGGGGGGGGESLLNIESPLNIKSFTCHPTTIAMQKPMVLGQRGNYTLTQKTNAH